jgi:hypothetical protein
MAEFYYDCTLDEWWPLLRAIIEEHSVLFAVDWWYPSPKCEYHDRLDESLKSHVLKTKRRVFFVGEAFSDGPLLLHQQSAGPRAGEYSIDLTRGGPMLDFIMPAQFQERGITWFSSG